MNISLAHIYTVLYVGLTFVLYAYNFRNQNKQTCL